MTSSHAGSARTLLLGALAVAAAAMVAALAILASRGELGGDAPQRPDEESVPLGLGRTDGGRQRVRASEEPEEGDDEEGPEGDIVEFQPSDRAPDGPEFWVTGETLRLALDARHWEEIRRMIDVLQERGTPVPPEIVKELVAMLGKDDLRLDAVLALGGVKDDATAKILADLAVSSESDPGARKAALDVLEKTGPKSVLPALQQLVADEGVDEDVLRHAYRALAGVGGPDATKTLLDLLVRHVNGDLEGALVVALGKAREADAGLALAVRAARDGGDKAMIAAALQAALIQGPAIGPELKAELLRTVESTATLTAFPDEIDKLRVQGAAMPAAVAAGLVEPVLAQATTSGIQRDIALNALRQARGDAAAKFIASAIDRSSDETVRRELTVALGETASRAVTPTLVALLDDQDANTRRAAARSLSQVRDPASVRPVLAALSKGAADYDFARQLVEALGTIGAREALDPLRKLAASEEAIWRQLRPFIGNAIVRIETGNPESLLLSRKADAPAEK